MPAEQPDGPPVSVDTTSKLYNLLRQRLRSASSRSLQNAPNQYEHNDDVFQSKEAIKVWAETVGVNNGVLELLDEEHGPLRDEMYDFFWDLHKVLEDIEISVGMRKSRSDGESVRSNPCPYFNSLLYTFSQQAHKFRDLANSDPRLPQTSTSTPTPPPADKRNSLGLLASSPMARSARLEEETLVQSFPSRFRNDSHSAYIKQEDNTPFQWGLTMSSPPLPWSRHWSRPEPHVKMEDVQADSSPSTTMSPNMSNSTHAMSPHGSSPPNSTAGQWSPQTPSNISLAHSSVEERTKAHDIWASKVLRRDEQPSMTRTIISPDPSFQPTSQALAHNQLPPIQPHPSSIQLATTRPRSESDFYFPPYQQSSGRSHPIRRSDS